MKIILISFVVACYSIYYYAPRFIKQLEDYKKSSACIAEKMNNGRARIELIAIGDTCKVR